MGPVGRASPSAATRAYAAGGIVLPGADHDRRAGPFPRPAGRADERGRRSPSALADHLEARALTTQLGPRSPGSMRRSAYRRPAADGWSRLSSPTTRVRSGGADLRRPGPASRVRPWRGAGGLAARQPAAAARARLSRSAPGRQARRSRVRRFGRHLRPCGWDWPRPDAGGAGLWRWSAPGRPRPPSLDPFETLAAAADLPPTSPRSWSTWAIGSRAMPSRGSSTGCWREPGLPARAVRSRDRQPWRLSRARQLGSALPAGAAAVCGPRSSEPTCEALRRGPIRPKSGGLRRPPSRRIRNPDGSPGGRWSPDACRDPGRDR